MDVAILKNDSVIPELRIRFPDYDEMIRVWLSPFFKKLGDTSKLTVYDLKAGVTPLYTHDLYVSSGSRSSVYEEERWIKHYQTVVQELHIRKRCHFGICFGHQMIAQALGGKVGKSSKGWGIGVHEWQVEGNTDFIDTKAKGISLPVSHKDQVTEVTPEMNTYLSSPFCQYAGFTIGKHIMSVQGHPEFSIDYVTAIMARRKYIYTEKEYNEGIKSLGNPMAVDTMLSWMMRFFFNQ